jgi:hypothetical protein
MIAQSRPQGVIVGRKMRPLNPAEGVAERFACELRALRAAAGEVPFWKMARRCDVSKSALAAAVAGHDLPSERVMLAYVQACGGDAQWWSERLAQARGQLEAERAGPAPGELPRRTAGAELARVRPVSPVLAMARASHAPRTAFAPGRSHPATWLRMRASRRLAAFVLMGVSLGLGVLAGAFLSLHGQPAPAGHAGTGSTMSPAPGGGGPFIYDETTGPGCIMVFAPGRQEQVAQVEPDSSVPCTFHIYIAASPMSKYNATYDWTNGVIAGDWVDANAFTVNQAAYAGSWYTDVAHAYNTGMAYLMLTDQRGDNPPSASAPLTASESDSPAPLNALDDSGFLERLFGRIARRSTILCDLSRIAANS